MAWRNTIETNLDSVKLTSEKNNLEVRNLLKNQSKRQSSAA